MRALVLSESGPRWRTDAPEPQADASTIIRPTLCAIGAADLRTIARNRFRGTLGHEFVGVIESIKGQPAGLRVGQRVTAWPSIPCAACDLCKGGLSTHCRDQRTLGQRGIDGCFADRIAIPTDRVIPIPDSLSDEHAIFAQPLGAAIHAARLVALEAQAFVTILGDSSLALLAAQVMARKNATVRLLTERERPLELCAKWGIRHRPTHQSGLRADQDVVVDCSGIADAACFGMIRPRGSVILAAPPHAPIDLEKAWANEIQLLAARGCAMTEALRELSTGAVQTDGLIERTLPFDQATDALALAARAGSLKIALRF